MKLPGLPVLSLVSLALVFSGCATLPGDHELQTLPEVQLANVRAEPVSSSIRRVAVLPVHTTQNFSEAQRDFDAIFRGELGKMLRFEVVPVTRPELSAVLQREQITSYEDIPAELLLILRDKYGADAVLFTEVTHYRPYRPLAIGVRCKLLELASQRVIWSADSVLDSANVEVADAARIYAQTPTQTPFPSGNVVLQSPRRFAAFAAHHIFSTLPPR
jgi:hypothetical protein